MSQPLQSLQNNVETKVTDNFEVDFFRAANDIVYHFYPHPTDGSFPESFHLKLEAAFKDICPEDTDIRAEYMEGYELRNFERSLRSDKNLSCSYWVRVMNLADKPMAERFLKEKIFAVLEKKLE
jgi:hypothetical protein